MMEKLQASTMFENIHSLKHSFFFLITNQVQYHVISVSNFKSLLKTSFICYM